MEFSFLYFNISTFIDELKSLVDMSIVAKDRYICFLSVNRIQKFIIKL